MRAPGELSEEIGLAIDPGALGPVVAHTSGYADLGFAKGQFRVDLSGLQPYERSSLLDHRWWTVDELATTAETMVPFALAPLLAALGAGRIPTEPVLLPWHH